MATNTDHLEFNEQGSAPSTPATGKWRLFFEADGLYFVDDGGNVYGPVPESALSNPMTTASRHHRRRCFGRTRPPGYGVGPTTPSRQCWCHGVGVCRPRRLAAASRVIW